MSNKTKTCVRRTPVSLLEADGSRVYKHHVDSLWRVGSLHMQERCHDPIHSSQSLTVTPLMRVHTCSKQRDPIRFLIKTQSLPKTQLMYDLPCDLGSPKTAAFTVYSLQATLGVYNKVRFAIMFSNAKLMVEMTQRSRVSHPLCMLRTPFSIVFVCRCGLETSGNLTEPLVQ